MNEAYFAILTCRNSAKTITDAVDSLTTQTLPPYKIIVVDDGSTDDTPAILADLKRDLSPLLEVITLPDLGYDITRLASNWNKALLFASDHALLEKCHYHLIATDDIVLEDRYCLKLIRYMQEHESVAVVSGNYNDKTVKSPHGAGRMVDNRAFEKMYMPFKYPEIMGHESAILYQTLRHGFRFEVVQQARYDHVRPLGKNHNFETFGASMRAMGFHPLFVLARCAKDFVKGDPIGRKDAVKMLYYYLTYEPSGGYRGMYDPDFRRFVRSTQLKRLRRVLPFV